MNNLIEGKPWSEDEISQLCTSRASGSTWAQIGVLLGRSGDSCRKKHNCLNKSNGGPANAVSRPWLDKDLMFLFVQRHIHGMPYAVIASELNRTINSCKNKYNSINWENSKFWTEYNNNKEKWDESQRKSLQERQVSLEDKKRRSRQMIGDIIADRMEAAINKLPTVNEVATVSIKPEDNKEEDMVLILSDIHIGEHYTLEETGGLGEFNETVLTRRMDNLKYAVRDIYSLHSKLYKLPNLHIFCLGDIVAGMNDVGQWPGTYINESIMEQFMKGSDHIARMIHYWLGLFDNVHFHGVMGNHGRAAPRNIEKDYVNWDYLAYLFLSLRLKDNERVSFNIPKAWWIMTEIKKYKFLLAHGDDIKSGGGLPTKGLLDFQQRMMGMTREVPDYTIAGHFHNASELTTNNGRVIINGSVVGGDMFSMKKLHASSKPEQIVFGVGDSHGMTWKYNIDLDYKRNPD